MPRTPDATSLELATRLGVKAAVATVVRATSISTSLQEIVLAGDVSLAGAPGNDVMIEVAKEGRPVRRRYSVRSVDEEAGTFTLWVATNHDGPGAAWASAATAGDELDVVGPRGKILLDELADWHLFIGDVSSLGAFYRMAESVEAPGRVIFIVQTFHADDMLTPQLPEGLGVTGIFVDPPFTLEGDPGNLLKGLAAFALPPDVGQAYLFGEFGINKAVRTALLDRGLTDEQISVKAFWRAGRANADHGEPDKN